MTRKTIIFAEERRQDIIELINRNGKVTVAELSKKYGVSSPTIRTDLAELEKLGLLRRTHGGAIPASTRASFELTSAEKEIRNVDQKKAIAKEAYKLINRGDVIALDTGTTTRELALLLADARDITVITYDIKIAAILESNENINLTLIGGNVRRGFHCTLGPTTKTQLSDLYADKAFMATNAVSLKRGLSTPNVEISDIKAQMIQNSRQNIALIDSSKFEGEALCKFADIKDMDVIISDEEVPAAFATAIKNAGCKLIKAK